MSSQLKLWTEKQKKWTLALAIVVPIALLHKHASKKWFILANSKLRYRIHQRACLFPFTHTASTQAHKEWKSFSRWALSSAPCLSSNWFFLPLNPVFWKHCYYPPVARCTDECLSTLSPMFLSQSLSKCWINQPFNSMSYHEAAKPHDRPIPTLFLLFFPWTKTSLLCGFSCLPHEVICTLVETFTCTF